MIKLTKIPYSFTSQIFGKSFRGLNWKKLSLKLGLTLSYFVVFILIHSVILGFIITDFGSKENANFDNSSSQFDKKFDTVIVLGAGLINNSVSPVLIARINHALDLHKKGAAKSIIFTGGIGRGQAISEGEASFNYALDKLNQEAQKENENKLENKLNNQENTSNLELKQIQNRTKHNFFFEKNSKTTKQNLFEAKQIMKQNKLETAIVVSDSLHLFRTSQIANLLNMKVQTSPTPYSRYQTLQSKSGFLFRELFFCQVFWITGN